MKHRKAIFYILTIISVGIFVIWGMPKLLTTYYGILEVQYPSSNPTVEDPVREDVYKGKFYILKTSTTIKVEDEGEGNYLTFHRIADELWQEEETGALYKYAVGDYSIFFFPQDTLYPQYHLKWEL